MNSTSKTDTPKLTFDFASPGNGTPLGLSDPTARQNEAWEKQAILVPSTPTISTTAIGGSMGDQRIVTTRNDFAMRSAT